MLDESAVGTRALAAHNSSAVGREANSPGNITVVQQLRVDHPDNFLSFTSTQNSKCRGILLWLSCLGQRNHNSVILS